MDYSTVVVSSLCAWLLDVLIFFRYRSFPVSFLENSGLLLNLFMFWTHLVSFPQLATLILRAY